MKVHRITVRNFRAITEGTIDLCDESGAPRPCTVLVGPNGSGKTTFLDALHLVYALVENAREPRLRAGLAVDSPLVRPDPSQPITIELTFSLDDPERATLERTSELLGPGGPPLPEPAPVYEFVVQYPPRRGGIDVTRAAPALANTALRGRAMAKLAVKQRLATEAIFDELGGFVYLPQERRLSAVDMPTSSSDSPLKLRERAARGDILPWLEYLARLDVKWNPETQGPSLWSRVRSIFADLAPPVQLEDLESHDEGFYLRFARGDARYRHISLSSGEEQVLWFATMLGSERLRRSVVAIDEIELHLHPRWQREVLGFCRRGGPEGTTQFILTTHSEDVLRFTAPEDVVSLWERR